MLRIRRVEEALAVRYAEQEMRCPMHLCIGQEAIAVGVSMALLPGEKMYSNHRAHGHYLAKGGDLTAMIAELYGRETGCCGGRGGSMHLIDINAGFMGATPIVGGTVPLAVGSAWAQSLQKTQDVTILFFGDGCFEEGVLHESMNFAALHKLPILFVCENNDFSVYTRRSERQPDRPIWKIAEAHGLRAACGDGNDVMQVAGMAEQSVAFLRAGQGPCFLEFQTYRWREHCGPNFDDNLNYRSKAEIAAGMASCPIDGFKKILLEQDLIDAIGISEMEQMIATEIEQAFTVAKASPLASPTDADKYVYA
jgi:pyruvate dehydrogenase E1 component alpha subunit